MEKKHINVVCGVIRQGEKVLCTQRLRKGLSYVAEHWEFPGGKVNDGEPMHEALLREIREEMDWKIYVGQLLGTVSYDYPDFSITLTAYDCIAEDYEFKLLAHLDARWLLPSEFSQLEWTAADQQLIKTLWCNDCK